MSSSPTPRQTSLSVTLVGKQPDRQIGTDHESVLSRANRALDLPPEILSNIFRTLSTLSRPSARRRRPSNPPSYGSQWPPSLRWIAVTHVCHYWRVVALNTPTLWTDLADLKLSPAWVQALLKRSNAAPVSVAYETGSPPHFLDVIEMVIEQPERLRGLDIRQHDYRDDSDRVQSLLSRLTKPAPFLRTLWVSGVVCIPVAFLGGYAPRLRSFTLLDAKISLRAPWLSSVQELYLHLNMEANDDKDIRMNISTVLTALQSLQNLEVLTVSWPPDMATQTYILDGTMFHFPRLRDIHFAFYESQLPMVDVFNHITLDSLEMLRVRLPTWVDESKEIETVYKFFELHARTTPQMIGLTDSSIHLGQITDKYRFELAKPSLHLYCNPKVWQTCITILPTSNLRIVQTGITGVCRYKEPVLQESDSVEELRVGTTSQLKFLLALQPTDTIPTPYPSLRRLFLRYISFKPNNDEVTADLKRWILGRESTRLEHLTIQCCRFSADHIRALEQLVAVTWDGLEHYMCMHEYQITS